MESKYEFYFSNRLSESLPDSKSWVIISNIDYMIFNYHSKKFMMIELKTNWREMDKRQRNMYNMLHNRFMKTNSQDWYEFVWTFLITFAWENWSDWFVFIEWTWTKKRRIDEESLKYLFTDILS